MLNTELRLRQWLTRNAASRIEGDKTVVVLTSNPEELQDLTSLLREGHDWFSEPLLEAIIRADVPICKECQEIVEGDVRLKEGLNCSMCA